MSNVRLLIKRITPSSLKTIYKRLRKFLISTEFKLFRIMPIKPHRVVLCNVWGYGDNPKWVAEALIRKEIWEKEKLDFVPEIIFVTDTDRRQTIPEGITVYKNNSFRAIMALATARVWLDCNRKEPYISKRKGQYYIQTWHGSLPLKKIERDCAEEFTEEYRRNSDRDTSMTNLYISNSDFCNEIYRRAFNYQGKILMCGSPRVDVLLGNIEKKSLTISEKELNVVYAPTFRGDGERLGNNWDGDDIVRAFEKKYGKSVRVVKRLHPLCLTKSGDGEGLCFKVENSVDGNSLGDLYEVLAAADILITDYSNTMFEFAYSGKPVFLFAPDKDEYANGRGMYFEYDQLPFPVSSSVPELVEQIEAYDEAYYLEKQKIFFEKFNLIENGNASEKVARVILRKLKK